MSAVDAKFAMMALKVHHLHTDCLLEEGKLDLRSYEKD